MLFVRLYRINRNSKLLCYLCFIPVFFIDLNIKRTLNIVYLFFKVGSFISIHWLLYDKSCNQFFQRSLLKAFNKNSFCTIWAIWVVHVAIVTAIFEYRTNKCTMQWFYNVKVKILFRLSANKIKSAHCFIWYILQVKKLAPDHLDKILTCSLFIS